MKQRRASSITGTRANPATAISELHATRVPPPDQMLLIWPTAASVSAWTLVMWPKAPDSDPVSGSRDSLKEVPSTLENDHGFLTEGGVFTPDLIETWVDYKRSNELHPLRLRPHPHEFEMYFDC